MLHGKIIYLHLQISPDREDTADDTQKNTHKKLGNEDQNEISDEISLNDLNIRRTDDVGSDNFHDRIKKNNRNNSRENSINYALENKGQANEIV